MAARSRNTNFSQEEANIILTEFDKHKVYLNSGFSNEVTNEGKKLIWNDIASKVNSVGVTLRTGDHCKKKWKSMKIEAKKQFHLREKARNQTGGGPPPKELKPCIQRTIDLMKDHASFKGVEGGLDMFMDGDDFNPHVDYSRVSEIEDPGTGDEGNDTFHSSLNLGCSSLQTIDTSAIRNEVSPTHAHNQTSDYPENQADTSATASNNDSSLHPPAPENVSRKRKRSLTVPERQAKVLEGEEEIQQLKRDNLRLMKSKLQIEVEVANLQKTKLQMEIALLRRQNPTLTDGMEGEDGFLH